jgi:hypothetical protein
MQIKVIVPFFCGGGGGRSKIKNLAQAKFFNGLVLTILFAAAHNALLPGIYRGLRAVIEMQFF